MDDIDVETAYRRCFAIIREKCARMLGDSAEAQDVAQETFTRLWSNRRALGDPASVLAWTYRTATRLAVDRLRRARSTTDAVDEIAGRPDEPERTLAAREIFTLLTRRLGGAELDAVVLQRVDGLTQLDEHQLGEGGTTGLDDDYARRSMEDLGAWIMGRNMFGPSRGPWPDDDWKGWWGSNPPYHVPVFVLTHHARKPIEMEGGTTFHFVTEGIEEALRRAKQAAGSRDVRVGGGVETVRQYVSARLVDEMHLAISPALLGSGEHLLRGLDLPALGYRLTEHVASEGATHIVIRRR